MNISLEAGLLVGSLLIFGSLLMSKAGYRLGIPTLFMFLLAGICFGKGGLGVEFDDASVAKNIGTIALCVILFSGGMDTKFKDIRPVLGPGIVLSTAGVLITTLLSGVFIYWISGWQQTEIGLSLMGSFLLAATISSTDSASVFNILRTQHIGLKYQLKPLLELESGSNDPMAYLLTIVFIQCILSGTMPLEDVARSFLMQFIIGSLGGYLLGKMSVRLINRVRLGNIELYPILTLCLIFIIYCITTLLGGNGFLAIYLAGLIVGNNSLFAKKDIGTFLNGLAWLFQVIMFLMLGLLVNPFDMLGVTVTALLVSMFLTLVARPVSVWICLGLFGKRFSYGCRFFVSWVGLRGAAPIIFATYPVIEHIDGAGQIFNIVFFVTLLSLLFQGISIPWMAKRFHLMVPENDSNLQPDK